MADLPVRNLLRVIGATTVEGSNYSGLDLTGVALPAGTAAGQILAWNGSSWVVKTLPDRVMTFTWTGPLLANEGGKLVQQAGVAGTLYKAKLNLNTVATGQAVIVDVRIEGTSAGTLTLPVSDPEQLYTAELNDVVGAMDDISVQITQIGTPPNEGSDLSVNLFVKPDVLA